MATPSNTQEVATPEVPQAPQSDTHLCGGGRLTCAECRLIFCCPPCRLQDAAQELVDWLKEQLGPEGATNAFEARMVFEELPDTFPQAASWPEAARRKAKQGAVAT